MHAAGGHSVRQILINPLQKTEWLSGQRAAGQSTAARWLIRCVSQEPSCTQHKILGPCSPQRHFFFLFNLKCVITPYFLPPVLRINFCRAPLSALIFNKLSCYPSPWRYLLPQALRWLMCIHVCRVAAGPKANQGCDPYIRCLIFLKLCTLLHFQQCFCNFHACYNGFWKTTVHKKCMERLETLLKFSAFRTQDILESMGTPCENSGRPLRQNQMYSH